MFYQYLEFIYFFYGTFLWESQFFYEGSTTSVEMVNLISILWKYNSHYLGVFFHIWYIICCIFYQIGIYIILMFRLLTRVFDIYLLFSRNKVQFQNSTLKC